MKAYRRFAADRVVAEVNQGGEMVAAMLKSIDETLPITTVRATRGKFLRAEPVAGPLRTGAGGACRPVCSTGGPDV